MALQAFKDNPGKLEWGEVGGMTEKKYTSFSLLRMIMIVAVLGSSLLQILTPPPHLSPSSLSFTSGLAGFTTESDASGTFCQIIKELVDNAVDALEGGGNVQIKVVPSSSASKILRLTVTDDGVGMEDPFSFANAFNSSKGQAAKERIKRAREGEDEDEGDSVMKYMRKSKSGKSWVCTLCKKKCLNEGTMRKHGKECQVGVEFEDHGDLDDDEFGLYVKDIGAYEASRWASSPGAQTAGRFGVGLTLCILHSFVGTGGRTVIRSTKRGSDVERVCALVADVGGDKIVEVGEGVGREGECVGVCGVRVGWA